MWIAEWEGGGRRVMDHVRCSAGCVLRVKDVITPKFVRLPFRALKSLGCFEGVVVVISPVTVTIFAC